jgi:hypothetical protein
MPEDRPQVIRLVGRNGLGRGDRQRVGVDGRRIFARTVHDLDAAHALVESTEHAELFLCRGRSTTSPTPACPYTTPAQRSC